MSKEDNSGEGKLQDASTADTPAKNPNAEIYENRGPKKIIRVVTVMAYLFSVSFVGIILSAYYIFLWEPPNPRLMQQERLRTDPQMQYLVAPAEQTELTKKDSSFLLKSEVNRVHKLFLGRMAHDTHDGDSPVDSRDKMNLEKKTRLNMVLLKLRHSLMDTLRAQNRNLSRETAISNDSFVGVENVLNSTIDRAESTITRYNESRGNISEKETYSDNIDLPPEFVDSISTLDVENTSSTSKFTTIPETETSQIHFDRDSITRVNLVVAEKNHKKELDTVELYLIRGSNNATTNSDVGSRQSWKSNIDQPVFGDHNPSKIIQEFPKIDRKESMKQNKTDDHQLVDNDRENDPGDTQSVILEERVNGSIKNPQENYSNGSFSEDQIEQITNYTDRAVLINPSSRDLGFTDDSGFHQTLDDPTVIKSRPRITETRNSEGERILADLPAFLWHWYKHGRAKRDCVIIQ